MPRLLHTADLHLGARHPGFGAAGTALRARRLGALTALVDLALAERVDAVLVAGDLFDGPAASPAALARVRAELARLVAARVPVVIAPGCHDPAGPGSIWEAADLAALAGADAAADLVAVLGPARPWAQLPAADVVVHHGLPGSGSTAPSAAWQVALVHADLDGPGAPGAPALAAAAIAASGLDYVALGHRHDAATGRAGGVTWGYPGAPEPVDLAVDRGGRALLVALTEKGGRRTVTAQERAVGRVAVQRLELDLRGTTQAKLAARLAKAAGPDVVLDVALVGDRPDALDVDPAALADAVRPDVLHVAVADRASRPRTPDPLPPAGTVAGAFVRDLEDRVASREAAGDEAGAAELREALAIGRHLLAGGELLP